MELAHGRRTFLFMIHLVLPVLFFGIALAIAARAKDGDRAAAMLRAVLLLSVGIQGVWAFLLHRFLSAEVAAYIGWNTSPFQHEIAFANLGFAVGGILSWFYPAFRAGTAVGIAIFMAGAASVHVDDMIRYGNFALGNAGPIFVADIVVPITLIACLVMSRRVSPDLKSSLGVDGAGVRAASRA